jgi:purine-binding chemotaxis protein CheW
MNTATLPEQVHSGLEGRYLTLALGREEYGIGILKIREIIGYVPIVHVPKTPAYVKGIINLRGQVIPVLDVRSRFEIPETQVTDQTCIIMVEVRSNNRVHHAGLIVDRVQEVLYIESKDIETTSQLGSAIRADFLLGVGKTGGSITILLDIDRVVQSDVVAQLTKDKKP